MALNSLIFFKEPYYSKRDILLPGKKMILLQYHPDIDDVTNNDILSFLAIAIAYVIVAFPIFFIASIIKKGSLNFKTSLSCAIETMQESFLTFIIFIVATIIFFAMACMVYYFVNAILHLLHITQFKMLSINFFIVFACLIVVSFVASIIHSIYHMEVE